MIEKNYIVRHIHKDYFGSQEEEKKFSSILEAFKYYKKASQYDFDYGDSFAITEKPFGCFSSLKEKQPKHGLVLGHKPTEMERWLYGRPSKSNKALDIKDVETLHVIEDKYVFDNDKTIF